MSARPPKDRPIMKLSVSLIETYKQINRVSFKENKIGGFSLLVRLINLTSFTEYK